IAAAMTPPATKALPLMALALETLLAAIAVLKSALAIVVRLRLRAGDERRQALDIIVSAILRGRLARLLAAALTVKIGITRDERLRLTRTERRLLAIAGHVFFVGLVVKVAVAGIVAGEGFLPRSVLRLVLAHLLLRRGDQPKVMLCVLIVVFRTD